MIEPGNGARVLGRLPALNRLVGLTGAVVAALHSAPAGAQTPPPPPDEERLQFAVSVETVTLDVVVVDKKGRFVPGLTRDSFEVLEDGLPQELSFFTAQFTPVTTLLLLDTSSSIRSSLSAIQTAAYLFTQNLSEGDKARVGLFNDEVRFSAGYTDDIAEHLKMLKSMKAEGRTALYDSILTALDELESVEGRKSLLVFTDGDDVGPANQGSRASIEEVIEGAKQSEVTIYTVGFTGWGPEGADSVNRPFLTTLAEATGGRPFFPEKVEEVKKAFAEVQQDLHRHYRMAYVPLSLLEGAGRGWRDIEVKVKKPGFFVRTRQGYYTRAPSE
jgi:Ca-activated chloride channel homolog